MSDRSGLPSTALHGRRPWQSSRQVAARPTFGEQPRQAQCAPLLLLLCLPRLCHKALGGLEQDKYKEGAGWKEGRESGGHVGPAKAPAGQSAALELWPGRGFVGGLVHARPARPQTQPSCGFCDNPTPRTRLRARCTSNPFGGAGRFHRPSFRARAC